MEPTIEPDRPDDLPPEQAERLLGYCAGTLSAAERAVVEQWVAASPSHAETLARLRAAWAMAGEDSAAAESYDVEAALVAARARRARRPVPSERQARVTLRTPMAQGAASPVLHRGHWVAGLFGLAAASLVVIGLRFARVPSIERAPTVYRTAAAQRAVVTLHDGTRVTLAPQSQLTVAATFGRDTRQVTLSGEAYFEATPDERRPFVVRTGTVQTQVLGTTFDVRQYRGEPEVRVAVTSGRVAVRHIGSAATSSTVVSRGMIARVRGAANDSIGIVVQNADVSSYQAWTTGQLVFHDASVPDVLDAVGRWYGYDFRMADSSLAARRITVTLDGQSLPDVMNFFKTLLGVSLTFDGPDGRTVTLHVKRITSTGDEPARDTHTRRGLGTQSKEVGK